MNQLLRIADDADEHRFSRFELITWWDQAKLSSAKVLVIGAGALGNEIVKNLALLGFGHVLIVDLDAIEHSNLSRSVLFRESDCGNFKAIVAARSAKEIYPGMRIQGLVANVVHGLGQGVFQWADVILCGLDNREARLAVNRAAARAGKPWIDGAIEGLNGVARVFDPAVGPCYECTMGENDWKVIAARRSCALLSREEMELGRVPTTPTTASVIAGIQTQEAVKWLHGLEVLTGQGFFFDGQFHQSYTITYSRKADCPAHEMDEAVVVLDERVRDLTVGDLLERVRSDLGTNAVLEMGRELLRSLECAPCSQSTPFFGTLGSLREKATRCPRCGELRAPRFYHTVDQRDIDLLGLRLSDIGVPDWDVLTGRAGDRTKQYEFRGDRAGVLGDVHHPELHHGKQ